METIANAHPKSAEITASATKAAIALASQEPRNNAAKGSELSARLLLSLPAIMDPLNKN